MKAIFWGDAIANLTQNGSSPLTELYFALHTADPGEGGSQTTSEVAYTGYTRMPVDRDSGGLAISGGSMSPVAHVDFPTCSAAPTTATHFSLGTASSGAGKVLLKGPITPNINVLVGGQPRLKNDTVMTLD